VGIARKRTKATLEPGVITAHAEIPAALIAALIAAVFQYPNALTILGPGAVSGTALTPDLGR